MKIFSHSHALQNKQTMHVQLVKNRSYFVPMHTHDGYSEFFILTGGSLLLSSPHTRQKVSSPTIIYVREHDVHALAACDDTDNAFIYVCIDNGIYQASKSYLGDRLFEELIETPEKYLTAALSKTQLRQITENASELTSTTSDSSNKLSILGEKQLSAELFTILLTNLDKPITNGNRQPQWFNDLLDKTRTDQLFIEGVSSLVSASGKSNAYLCKCFRQYMHSTPSAYVNTLRIDHAKSLLITTDLSVTDIMFECGFNNLSHFYHIFNEQTFMTPQAYRKAKSDAMI